VECWEFGRRGAVWGGQTVEAWAIGTDCHFHTFETRRKKEVKPGSEDAVVRGPMNSTNLDDRSS